jgi:aspartyl aminopeptidase
LCLEGVVYRKDGSKLELSVGRKDSDPVFTITDLLPHLAQEQMTKTAGKVIEGEKLNVLIGSIPLIEGDKDPSVKKAILGYLNREYGLIEEDFLRAELEILPNIPPRDIGFDRSMIGAYGQDDRICAYSLMKSFFEGDFSSSNVLACFFDKEEIGSNGDTGAQSRVLEYLMEMLLEKTGMKGSSLEVFFNSKGLSADVSAVDDPSYEGVFDKYNRGRLGFGPIISKYSGSRGKYDANDTSAEFLSYVMGVLDKSKVMYQFGELGKVDLGGGGTIASYLSQLGMEIVDMGTGLLSMHSPFEVASKADLYMTYLGYRAFLEN